MIVIDMDGRIREERYDGSPECVCKAGKFDIFDVVRLRDSVVMLVDDNGLLVPDASSRVNWKATYLRLNQWMDNPQDIDWRMARLSLHPDIVGDVVLLGIDDGGELTGLDDGQRKFCLEMLGEWQHELSREMIAEGREDAYCDHWRRLEAGIVDVKDYCECEDALLYTNGTVERFGKSKDEGEAER